MPRRSDAVLDGIDRAILSHLEHDGRATLPELATAARLSPSACQRRLRRLEAEGVIRGYRAVLDADAVGRGVVVFLSVVLVDHTTATIDAFERGVLELAGLVSAHHVTGDTDYLLRVDVADLAELDELTRNRLPAVPGVGRFTTSLAMRGLVDVVHGRLP